MKKIIKWSIIIVVLLIIFFLFFGKYIGPQKYTEKLSGGYIFQSKGHDFNKIRKNIYIQGDKYIPSNVINYSYNDIFIIAAQEPNNYDLYLYNHVIDSNNFYNYQELIEFWIISHEDSTIYGPMSLSNYIKKRKELSVPEDLKLKLKI